MRCVVNNCGQSLWHEQIGKLRIVPALRLRADDSP